MTREQIEKANELLKEIESVDNIVDMIENYDFILKGTHKIKPYKKECNVSDTMQTMFLECCETRKAELEKELEEL